MWCLYLAYAAPKKGTTILYWFRSPKTVLNPPVNCKIQGLFKAFQCFQVLFKANLIFKDLSKQSCIFKYFSSQCEPCSCLISLTKRTTCFMRFCFFSSGNNIFHLSNHYDWWHYEEYIREIISNLDQWFRRRCHITLCMLCNFSCFCCLLLTFSKLYLKENLSVTLWECQTVSNQIKPDENFRPDQGPNSVCKDYQQATRSHR